MRTAFSLRQSPRPCRLRPAAHRVQPRPAAPPPREPEFRALYKELIEINTTLSEGSCTKAAEAMKARLVSAGYPSPTSTSSPISSARRTATSSPSCPDTDTTKKPIMLLAHIDVVEAKREDWVRDPFKLTEEGGYFYARGAMDDKAMAAIFTDSMVRYKREGYKPARTLKLVLTCGEESPNTFNGVNVSRREPPRASGRRIRAQRRRRRPHGSGHRQVCLQRRAGRRELYQDFTIE